MGGTALGGRSWVCQGADRRNVSGSVALAARGDSSEVDTLVEDIYGSTGCVTRACRRPDGGASREARAAGPRRATSTSAARCWDGRAIVLRVARGRTRRSGGARSASFLREVSR